ncbi:hypothetical protein CsSME_00050494 [Camellia sinensis var. sinensis]
MALTCTSKLVLGSFSFAVFWVLAVFPVARSSEPHSWSPSKS